MEIRLPSGNRLGRRVTCAGGAAKARVVQTPVEPRDESISSNFGHSRPPAPLVDCAAHAALRGVLVRLRPRPRLVRAFVADLPEEGDPPEVATYCPPCAEKHFDKRHANATTPERTSDRSRALTETAPGGELVVRASVVVANLREGAAYPTSLHWGYVPWRYEEPSF
jgi:hypothetical protein